MPDAISDVQRNTPPWQRGLPLYTWLAERGVVWSQAEAAAMAESWHAAGDCPRTCDYCRRRRERAA